jgi:PAS domain S-box-containing protein
VVYQNKAGEIISANPAARKILGLTLDQMKGKTSVDPDWNVITQDGKALNGSKHPSMVALKTGKPVKNFVMGVFHPKKERHQWIRVNAIPEYKDDDTNPFQVFTMFEDITDYIEMEEKQGQAMQDISGGDDSK